MADPYKNAIRSTLKKVRASLSSAYKRQASYQICKRIQGLESYRQAKNVALYCAVQGEIDLDSLWDSAPLHGKRCFFPILNGSILSFMPANPQTTFKNNKYGIPEPLGDQELIIPLEQLDLMIVPIVAFDKRCTRLGMGSGYYDRTLEQAKPKLLFGVAFQFQMLNFINPEPWDIPLDAVITQKSIYWR